MWLLGKTKPDEGKLFFGEAVDLLSMDEPSIAQIGIGRKFQNQQYLQIYSFEILNLQ